MADADHGEDEDVAMPFVAVDEEGKFRLNADCIDYVSDVAGRRRRWLPSLPPARRHACAAGLSDALWYAPTRVIVRCRSRVMWCLRVVRGVLLLLRLRLEQPPLPTRRRFPAATSVPRTAAGASCVCCCVLRCRCCCHRRDRRCVVALPSLALPSALMRQCCRDDCTAALP
jgi:hypothetical protein